MSSMPIYINSENVENVTYFVFLGSNIPGSTNEIKRKIGMASSSFGRLKSRSSATKISTSALNSVSIMH